jgi:receptor protein-tyrosine kinase
MQFDSWLKKMAEQFDVILIDTPPAALYTDAVIIAAKTAGALIVTRKDHTHHSETREVTDSLTNAGVEVVGAILNRF